MATLDVKIQPGAKRPRKIRVEMDTEEFERLAASLGLFGPGFLESLDRAEHDYRKKRTRRISSLKELRIRNDRSSRD